MKEMLPSGQPYGGGLVGDDEEAVRKGVVGKNGKTTMQGLPGKSDKTSVVVGLEVEFGDDLSCATAEIIEKSSCGTTYKATLEDDNEVVVKRLREKTSKGQREFEKEVVALREKLPVFDYIPIGKSCTLPPLTNVVLNITVSSRNKKVAPSSPTPLFPLSSYIFSDILSPLFSFFNIKRPESDKYRRKEEWVTEALKGCLKLLIPKELRPPTPGSKHPHLRRIFRRVSVSRGNGSSSSSSSALKLVNAENFAGIALLTLIRADMQQFKDKWIACVSFGEQTFRTHISDQTDNPVWNSEKKLLLEKNGPRLARISVIETNRISKNNIVGYCEIDLLELLTQDSDSDFEVFELVDPLATGKVVGKISLSCSVEDPIETEKNFARRILSIVDYNEDGKLSFSEFSDLIKAFGNQVADNKKEELFKAADKNGDDAVSMDELAELLAIQQENEPLINCCPVCGEILEVSEKLNTLGPFESLF
ncbi:PHOSPHATIDYLSERINE DECARBOXYLASE [Salix koriyanagi]|uniref:PHOSPHATIDYLSERINE DECARBOXYLASE n=1 Tax=Salix koriyanagi TaxID=2511006 RepID=A0A9Q0T5A0_9ROSI|nr:PHOSPHATIDYLSERINE DECARBOXYLASE [Salix koriyanagi]